MSTGHGNVSRGPVHALAHRHTPALRWGPWRLRPARRFGCRGPRLHLVRPALSESSTVCRPGSWSTRCRGCHGGRPEPTSRVQHTPPVGSPRQDQAVAEEHDRTLRI